MKIVVKFFARYRDLAGVAEAELEVDGKNVGEVLPEIEEKFPRIPWGEVLISVNHKYADSKTPLKEGDIISIFPPVSGG